MLLAACSMLLVACSVACSRPPPRVKPLPQGGGPADEVAAVDRVAALTAEVQVGADTQKHTRRIRRRQLTAWMRGAGGGWEAAVGGHSCNELDVLSGLTVELGTVLCVHSRQVIPSNVFVHLCDV